MYICHCRAVSDREITAKIQQGAESVDDLGRRCGAGAGCGGCRPVLAELLEEERRLRRSRRESRALVTVGGR
jgi:bacterioferritin-associated ferredoxin